MTEVLPEVLESDAGGLDDPDTAAESGDAGEAGDGAGPEEVGAPDSGRPAPESLGQTAVRVLKRTGLWYLVGFPAILLARLVRARPTAAASAGTALTILGTFLLGFVADTAVIGRIRHDRDRQNEYAHFRFDLANGTAPLGALDVDGNPTRPGTPVAVLQIPGIGVHEVVDYGTSSSILMSGPGLRPDSVLPGQVGGSVIMGRRALYGGAFRNIGELRPGESIVVTTGAGISDFKVVDVRRPGDKIPAEVVAAPASLVLMTAGGGAYLPHDLLRVDAVLVDPKTAQPAGPVAGVPDDDKPLAGESEAWIPLVLWGQGLVLAAAAVTWLRARWGRRQAWLVGAPVLAALGLAAADTFARLLPNMM